MTKFTFRITQDSAVLPVIHTQEITPAQVSILVAVAKADLTYGEVLAWLAERVNRPGALYIDGDGETWRVGENGNDEFVAGAGESVEAFRG